MNKWIRYLLIISMIFTSISIPTFAALSELEEEIRLKFNEDMANM